MATIALYANKINQMPGLIKDVKRTVTDYNTELFALKTKTLTINKSVCNLDDVISSIQTSTQTQEQKITSLDTFNQNSENFISEVVRIDGNVADVVKQRKDDFYDKYYYLKPECEKNGWEKFKDGCKEVGEWCKEHWKIIVTIVLVIVAVAIIILCPASAVLLLGIAKGIIIGAVTGGLMGGLTSLATGGSFWEGFENGAFSGALIGALFGGLGGAGQMLGGSCKALSALGGVQKVFTVMKYTSRISGVISIGMAGFDLLSWGAGLIDVNNPLTAFNQKLHSSKLYNAFQFTVSAMAVFSGGAYQRMKQGSPSCFVAGTMILTASGLVAIENIKAGNKVISTNENTFETSEKQVLETYIRKSNALVHIWIDGEETKVTPDHPFYVPGRGWVNVGELAAGDQLRKPDGKLVSIQKVEIKALEKPVTVYNFQVADFHSYYAGRVAVLVHNASYEEKVAKLNANKEQGKAFEKQTKAELQKTQSDVVEQITVKTESGQKTRLDFLGKKGDVIKPTEAKSSSTAGLTGNQTKAFPEIEKSGAVVVGKGKEPFPGGTKIPPIKVNIVRPKQ